MTEGEPERLTEEFIIEYTYNSNAIEGSTLTLRETDMVLRGLTIDRKPLKDHIEAVGNKEAFDCVRNLVKKRISYYNAFDEYHVKHNLAAMEKLLSGYVNARLDNYLEMLDNKIEERLKAAFVDIAQRHGMGESSNILIVTHAFAIKTIIHLFAPEQLDKVRKVKNASVFRLVFENGVFSLEPDIQL